MREMSGRRCALSRLADYGRSRMPRLCAHLGADDAEGAFPQNRALSLVWLAKPGGTRNPDRDRCFVVWASKKLAEVGLPSLHIHEVYLNEDADSRTYVEVSGDWRDERLEADTWV